MRSNIIQKVKSLIISGRIDEAISVLTQGVNSFPRKSQKLIFLFSFRYNYFKRQNALGLTSDDSILLKIIYAILGFLDKTDSSSLKLKKTLKISDLCDRF